MVTEDQGRATWTVEEAAELLGIGRNSAYEAISRNELPHVRIGRRLLVPRIGLEAWLSASAGDERDA